MINSTQLGCRCRMDVSNYMITPVICGECKRDVDVALAAMDVERHWEQGKEWEDVDPPQSVASMLSSFQILALEQLIQASKTEWDAKAKERELQKGIRAVSVEWGR